MGMSLHGNVQWRKTKMLYFSTIETKYQRYGIFNTKHTLQEFRNICCAKQQHIEPEAQGYPFQAIKLNHAEK